jgi:hypothetical protein
MKKIGVLLTISILLLSLTLIIAAEGDNCTAIEDCDTGEICEEDICTIEEEPETTTGQQQPDSKTEEGFKCLEEKAKDCSSLTTQEVALTILATPDNIFDDCVAELRSRKSQDHWDNVRDTALAVLAMKHAGEDTEASETWLLAQEETPTDLEWYMQQDSNVASECHIGYQSNDYIINVGANKKIDRNAGVCLTRAQSNFWLKVNPNCYEEEFSIECDQSFIASLLYKNKNAPTFYILEGTDSEPAFGSIKLTVKSKCFGEGSCDYEATIWTTLALLETGHNIEDFIPYIVAMSDTNERYLPESFIYILTNYEDYATQLIAEQKLGNYWEAPSSAYNRYYDTSIALIALGSSSSEQITKARDWLLFSQSTNGCWQNSVRETAVVLWALTGRTGRTATGGSTTRCSEADYFCIPTADCVAGEDVGNNYFCPSLSTTCCTDENLKTCSEYDGEECSTDELCVGNERKSTDIEDCCTGECKPRPVGTECEDEYFYTCKDECSDFQEEIDYSCDSAERVCCRTKTEEPSSQWWIWVLIILIIAVLVAIGFIFRHKLKLLLFRIKSKFKKDKGKRGPSPRGPPRPPRPGFPPVRRPRPPVAPIQRRPQHKDAAMSETFKKLKEMSR